MLIHLVLTLLLLDYSIAQDSQFIFPPTLLDGGIEVVRSENLTIGEPHFFWWSTGAARTRLMLDAWDLAPVQTLTSE